MAQEDSVRRWVAFVAFVIATSLPAQVRETPVAFDSAGRVRALTPSLVARLGLAAPAWPVTGPFREARLYALSTGDRVLHVELVDRAVDRFDLPDGGAALQAAIDAAIARTGAIATDERADEITESARGHFMRRQLGLAWLLYGPLLGSMFDDPTTSSVVTLASVPASFLIVYQISRNTPITRAQSTLSLDAAVRGGAAGAGTFYLVTDETLESRTARLVALGSAMVGSVYGFRRARGWTDGEVKSTTTTSDLAVLTALGLLGATDVLESDSPRAVVGTLMAAGLAGYAIGPRYARQPGFAVTGGDVSVVTLGSTLGVMAALAPVVGSDFDSRTFFTYATAGLVGGTFLGHRLLVVPFDYSTNDATLTWLGAGAGSLAGSALSVLAKPGPSGTLGLVTAGAIAGAFGGHAIAKPPRARGREMGRAPRDACGAALDVSLTGLTLAAAGVPGRHVALTLKF